MTLKIVYFTGTRADYGLMSSVLKILHSEFELIVIVTGMHLDPLFGGTINEIKKNSYTIKIIKALFENDDKSSTLNFISKLLPLLTKELELLKPDLVVLLGDRSEALGCAIVCQYLNIPVAHISGGDRSGHVDDSVRHAISKLAHVHFPICEDSADNLICLGESPQRIFTVGSTSLDNIFSHQFNLTAVIGKYQLPRKYCLLIEHPILSECNLAGNHMKLTLEAISSFNLPTVIIYPNADAGGREIIEVINSYTSEPWIYAFPHIPYDDFLALFKGAKFIIGNSSSGIIESSAFNIPAINLGTRQSGRFRGNNVLDAPFDREAIRQAINKALYDQPFINQCKAPDSPYGNGTAAQRIYRILQLINPTSLLNKQSSHSIFKPRFKRFNELLAEDVAFDYQIHTIQTHGFHYTKQIIASAVQKGLNSIAITEHVRSSSNWFPWYKRDVALWRRNSEVVVLVGIETKPLDYNGTLDAPLEVLKQADLVIGSVHRYPGEQGLISLDLIKDLGEDKAAEIELKLALGLLKNSSVTILGHPFGVYSRVFQTFPEKHLRLLMTELAKTDVAFEISTKYRLDWEKLFPLLKETNPYISFGSDAHNRSDIANDFVELRVFIAKFNKH